MSETLDDARQAAATEPSVTEPATLPATTDQTTDTDQTTQTEEQKPEPKPDARDRAIRQLAFEQREARRQLAAYREQLERLQPRDPNAPPAPADVERLVEERARAIVEQREQAAKSEAWVAKGNADFPDFTERCNTLADMGAGENPAFMQAIGKLPNGHKVIAELASDPAETQRILKLPPIDMALEMAGLSARIAAAPAPAPKPVSAAPAPIKPITAAARAEVNPENMTPEQYQKWWNKRTRG